MGLTWRLEEDGGVGDWLGVIGLEEELAVLHYDSIQFDGVRVELRLLS